MAKDKEGATETKAAPASFDEIQVAAKAAYDAGDFAAMYQHIERGKALKALSMLTPPEIPTRAEVKRLDLAVLTQTAGAPSLWDGQNTDAAVKSFMTKKFGDLPAMAEQMARELYTQLGIRGGEDYAHLYWAKSMDYARFLRKGFFDPELERVLVLTPQQILDAAHHGWTVKEIKANMIEGQDSLGGYLVPEDVRMDVIARLPGLTIVRQRASVTTTNRDRVSFPVLTGGSSIYPGNVRVTWVDESPTGTEAATNETWGQVAIPVHTTMASAQFSKNLLEDSAFDLPGRLNYDVTVAYALDEDNFFLTGNGVGRPQGILKDNLTGGPTDANTKTVKTNATATLTADQLIAVPFTLDAQYRNSPGIAWGMTKATLQIVRSLKDGQGRYLWDNNITQLADFKGPTLLGWPIAESEQLPATASGNYPIIFGDFGGYQVVDRVGMSMLRYDDSTTAKQNAVVYVARRRLGGQVVQGWRFLAHQVST